MDRQPVGDAELERLRELVGAQDERYRATLELVEWEAPSRPEAHNRALVAELDARISDLKGGRRAPLPAFVHSVFASTSDACDEVYKRTEIERLPFGCAPTDLRAFAAAATEFIDQTKPDLDGRTQSEAECVYLQAVDDSTSEREIAITDDEVMPNHDRKKR